MEENQVPNPGQQFNVTGEPKKKKGMGPVKGLIVAFILAIIVIAVGFLIRMLVQGDGDYFLPFKQMFGIEEEEGSTSKKKSKKTTNTVEEPEEDDDDEEEGQKGDPLGGKYTKLSSAVSGDKVEHYRLSANVGEMLEKILKEVNTDELNFGDDESGMGSMVSMMLAMLKQFADVVDGEVYYDVYFEGNDLIQIVIGYDYDKLVTKLYKYMKKESPEALQEMKITDEEGLKEYLCTTLNAYLTEDQIYEMMISDEKSKKSMEEIGLSKKDILDAIDLVNEEGLVELYITGTTKVKGIISLVLGTKDFKDSLKQFEDQYDIEIDEDDIFSSLFKSLQDSDDFEELEDYGVELIKIK